MNNLNNLKNHVRQWVGQLDDYEALYYYDVNGDALTYQEALDEPGRVVRCAFTESVSEPHGKETEDQHENQTENA